MAIKITTWRPDTCGCEISYSWDDSVPQDQRVHQASKSSVICSFHTQHANSPDNHLAALLDENSTKNVAVGVMLSNFPAITKDVLDEDGNVIGKRFAKGMAPAANFSPLAVGAKSRAPLIDASVLSQPEKDQLQSLVDKQLGAGKVTIVGSSTASSATVTVT